MEVLRLTSIVWVLLNIGFYTNATNSESIDESFPELILERVAFGSCNKQLREAEQSASWASVSEYEPQLWLWTGDAVYSHNHSLAALKESFAAQSLVSSYTNFLSRSEARVDGVWVRQLPFLTKEAIMSIFFVGRP